MPDTTVIRLDNVSKTFGHGRKRVEAVRQLSLNVAELLSAQPIQAEGIKFIAEMPRCKSAFLYASAPSAVKMMLVAAFFEGGLVVQLHRPVRFAF